LAIEPSDALAEGAALEEVLALLQKVAGGGAVLCTHGDVLPMLLDNCARRGVDIGPAPQWPKGCTWVLETDTTGEVTAAEYLAPPSG
jgi:8-oxo-dGTP diphosphatase